MKHIKTILTIIISAIIGFYISSEMELEGMIVFIFFFGIFIIVGLIIELLFKYIGAIKKKSS